MKLSRNLKIFLGEYHAYEKRILNPTLEEVNAYLRELEKPEYWKKYTISKDVATPSPIRMIMSRIKQAEKVVEKIFRKSSNFPEELTMESVKQMHDTIGIRIIVYFSSQLSLIDRELRNSKVLEMDENNPPEAFYDHDKLSSLGLSHIRSSQKESGYSSIHYMMRLKESTLPKEERPLFEIQVRTLAQELWCELEHVLSYKPETRPHFSAKRRFQILSKEVAVIDEHFNLLYEELMHNQETATYKETDLLTFENTPKVLAEIGIQCALTELYPITKTLFSSKIQTVKQLLSLATPIRLLTIRNTYISKTGHAPNNIELISALALLKGAKSREVEIARIKSQIDLHA